MRHSCRSILYGFSKFFSSCSNNEAELRVAEGIRLYQQLGHTTIDIECDSSIVVYWILTNKCTIWYLWDYWDRLRSMLGGYDFSIKHFYREGNQVADSLARRGAMGYNNFFTDCFQLPQLTRGFYKLDKMVTVYVIRNF